MERPSKMSFEEIIRSMMVFYNNEDFEKKFDRMIENKANRIIKHDRSYGGQVSIEEVVNFINTEEEGLRRIIYLLDISQEKFKRIVSLLRRLDDDFETEWSMSRIERKIREDEKFAEKIAGTLINGCQDPVLKKYLPLTFRERLNLQQLTSQIPPGSLKTKLKIKYQAEYSDKKGDLIEDLIEKKLMKIKDKYGIPYESGRTPLIDVTTDFSVPNLKDPHVIIMSTYQETTGSGQSTKARDMVRAYESIEHKNINSGENRAFVNFIDGGGWLARQSDLRKMIDGCHYVLTINTLDKLNDIILYHVPDHYKD